MQSLQIPIWENGEYDFPYTFGFVPKIHAFLHEDDRVRPAMLVIPGGGYGYCSEREGKPVAMTFYEKGYQTFVLPYTTNLFFLKPLENQPLRDITRAMRILRANAEEFRIHSDEIIVCGFSAGAHLSGSLALYHDEILDLKYPDISARPDLLLLCYPVITSGAFAHKDSMRALLGDHPTEAQLEKASLEKNVTSSMPATFLFQTAGDGAVPVENSCLMAEALKKAGVPFAHHVFTTGGHGLSIATQELTDRENCDLFTLEQVYTLLEAWEKGLCPEIEEEAAQAMIRKFYPRKDPAYIDLSKKPNDEVAVWPLLADQWIRTMLEKR